MAAVQGQQDPRAHNDKRFLCTSPGCGRTYTSSSSLSRHMQVHTGKFSFFCERCRKGFNERTNYDQHVAKHEGRSFYLTCQVCSKKFISQRRLMDHMSEAHVEYNYNCDVCGEGFNSLSRFKEHERTHVTQGNVA